MYKSELKMIIKESFKNALLENINKNKIENLYEKAKKTLINVDGRIKKIHINLQGMYYKKGGKQNISLRQKNIREETLLFVSFLKKKKFELKDIVEELKKYKDSPDSINQTIINNITSKINDENKLTSLIRKIPHIGPYVADLIVICYNILLFFYIKARHILKNFISILFKIIQGIYYTTVSIVKDKEFIDVIKSSIPSNVDIGKTKKAPA